MILSRPLITRIVVGIAASSAPQAQAAPLAPARQVSHSENSDPSFSSPAA
ncbi:MAG: hypothetical protein ACREND_07225 [Gemmatimonadaceae bacterium]